MPVGRMNRERGKREPSEEEVKKKFAHLQQITSRLARVPKADLELKLAEKRLSNRRRAMPAG
jgi:hypothetical protein